MNTAGGYISCEAAFRRAFYHDHMMWPLSDQYRDLKNLCGGI